LDVSALVAFGFSDHEFHAAIARWSRSLAVEHDEFATCAITELGFVRILSNLPQSGVSVEDAKALLLRLKSASEIAFVFLADDQDASQLSSWVRAPKQITDGHLVQLAKANGAVLATLDRKIPAAFLIPQEV
jgi:uncharacterized protein